ncbi:MAG: type II toxin-antitoxin system Phd/YefM family antitoxin [Deltaproteobacteria bacterium]|nr:type II toxin-antitoxin system Phd/YefM family antitoxin [Deltaproteobacteria bacterium]
MLKTNALKLRQSLGHILSQLKRTGQPVLIEKNREPAAVIISLDDYQKRFVDKSADDKRNKLIQTIKQARIALPKGVSSQDLLSDLRS